MIYSRTNIKYIWKARKKYITSLGKYGPRDTFIPWAKTGIDRYYAFKTNDLNLLEENGFKVILEHTARNILFICKILKVRFDHITLDQDETALQWSQSEDQRHITPQTLRLYWKHKKTRNS